MKASRSKHMRERGGLATARPRPALGAAPSEGTAPGIGAFGGRADGMGGQRYDPGRKTPPPTLHAPPPTHAQGRGGRHSRGLTTPYGSLRPVMRVRLFGAPWSASGSKNPPLRRGGGSLSLTSRSGMPPGHSRALPLARVEPVESRLRCHQAMRGRVLKCPRRERILLTSRGALEDDP